MKNHEFTTISFSRSTFQLATMPDACSSSRSSSLWTNVPLLLLGAGTAALAVQDGSLWILGSGLGIAFVSILKLVFAF